MFKESEDTTKKGKIKVMYVGKDESTPANQRNNQQDRRNKKSNRTDNDRSERRRSENRGHESNRFESSRFDSRRVESKRSEDRGSEHRGSEHKKRNHSSDDKAWLKRHDDRNENKRYESNRSNHQANQRESFDNNDNRFDQPYTQHLVQERNYENEHEDQYAVSSEQLRTQRKNESKVYGENACLALFKNRPESIIKAWFVESITPKFRESLRYLAANKKAYHVVDSHELQKVSGTEHHGGVCFLIKKRTPIELHEYLALASKQDCIIALEGVANPHNIGAILRSAAHFGIKAVLHADSSVLDSGAAIRTAEGGAEYIQAIHSEDFIGSLAELQKAGYTLVSTSSHKGKSLFTTQLPEKSVILIGQEGDGLTDSSWEKGQLRVAISGTGKVESLNVSVATSIILAHWWQQQVK